MSANPWIDGGHILAIIFLIAVHAITGTGVGMHGLLRRARRRAHKKGRRNVG